ncbi:MAG: heavy metal-binding domain-containing protein [Zoogloeaceae bacterium]|nr:heavy metal-binding domain-containing protein [Zoogloeaceae bacterium]MCK6383850.1 YbjQ family protein [Rhodocyclaceae bacterium]
MPWVDYLDWIVFLALLAVGYFSGRAAEARHYASIRRREKELAKVLAFATKYPPAAHLPQQTRLVSGSVVVGSDYFKQFVAGLRTLLGGRMKSYETLLDRARREAVLRMKEEARRSGYRLIVNVRIESTNITGGNRGGLPAVEAFAYGTALKPPAAIEPARAA